MGAIALHDVISLFSWRLGPTAGANLRWYQCGDRRSVDGSRSGRMQPLGGRNELGELQVRREGASRRHV